MDDTSGNGSNALRRNLFPDGVFQCEKENIYGKYKDDSLQQHLSSKAILQ